MKDKVPKAKCEKCKHLKIMTEEKVVICDYLNAFHKELFTMAWNKPYLCPNFERRVKNER
jgi:hypothetical protein